MHRHQLFEFWKVGIVHITDLPWIAAESVEVGVVTHYDNTVLCHAHIGLQHLDTLHQSHFESLESVFWSFPTTASVSNQHVTKTELCKRNFEFSSLSVEEPRHFCKNNVQKQVYHHSYDHFAMPKTIAGQTNHSYKGEKRPF